MNKTIGILTGGGDVPGLNSVIKSVVYRADEFGSNVIGIRKGWEGLTHMDPAQKIDPEYVRILTRENTRHIDRTGGTILHTSRTNPANMKGTAIPHFMEQAELDRLRVQDDLWDFTPVALRNLEKLGIDILIAIGGDDTLSYGARLCKEGFPVICIPKTMDNDVQGTEYCIGFSTAITRAKELITRQRTTIGSHERIAVFRIFGRDAGFSALYTSYVTSTRCLIPEHEFDLEHVCELMIEDKKNNPSNYALIVASEGATWTGREVVSYGKKDAYGHQKKVNIGEALAFEIERITGAGTMSSDLTYDLRSGEPDSLDHMVAITFANIAMDMIMDGISGRMLCIQNAKYAHTTIPDKSLGARTVDVESLYDVTRYRPSYAAKLGAPILLDTL